MQLSSAPPHSRPGLQDIAGGLEGTLSATALQPAAAGAAGSPRFHWAPSAAVWAGLQRCASPDVFLPQLADKFVRLALQLLARYAAWILSGMQARAEAAGAAATGAAGDAVAAGGREQQPQQQQQQAIGSRDGGSGGGTWDAAASSEQLAALRQDIDSLLAAVLSTFVPQLSALLAGLPAETGEAVASAFAEAAEQLEAAGGALMEAVAESLTEKSVVVLKQVRSGRGELISGRPLHLQPSFSCQLRMICPARFLPTGCKHFVQDSVHNSVVANWSDTHTLAMRRSSPHPSPCTFRAAARHRGHFPHDEPRAAEPAEPLRIHDPRAAASVPAGKAPSRHGFPLSLCAFAALRHACRAAPFRCICAWLRSQSPSSPTTVFCVEGLAPGFLLLQPASVCNRPLARSTGAFARLTCSRAPLQGEAASQLSSEARQQLAAAVAAGVSSRYLHLADDTLRWAALTAGPRCSQHAARLRQHCLRHLGRLRRPQPRSTATVLHTSGCMRNPCVNAPLPPQHRAQDRIELEAAKGAAAGRRGRRRYAWYCGDEEALSAGVLLARRRCPCTYLFRRPCPCLPAASGHGCCAPQCWLITPPPHPCRCWAWTSSPRASSRCCPG